MTKLKYTLTRDTLFKLFFTKDMNLLRSFIADALYLNHDSITDIKITNPEIQPDFVKGKLCRLDLRLVVDEQVVDVEVQVEDEGNFKERSLFYWTKLMSETLVSGKDYKTIPKVILINIIDFKLFGCIEYHSDFRVMEKTRYEELTDKFAMHFFELPKVPGGFGGGDGIVKWLNLFRAKTEEDLEKIESSGGKEMAQAVQLMRDLSRSPEFLHLETMREMSRLDEGQRLSNAREEGEKRGIVIGEERGYAKRQPEIDALKTNNNALKISNDVLLAEIAELRRKLGNG